MASGCFCLRFRARDRIAAATALSKGSQASQNCLIAAPKLGLRTKCLGVNFVSALCSNVVDKGSCTVYRKLPKIKHHNACQRDVMPRRQRSTRLSYVSHKKSRWWEHREILSWSALTSQNNLSGGELTLGAKQEGLDERLKT